MDANDIVVVAGARTPFSRFGGPLRAVPSVDLCTTVVRALVDRDATLREAVDEVYLGVTIAAEYAIDGPIPARVAMLKAGLPDTVRSLTLDRACCSSMTAVQLAERSLRLQETRVVVAGGADNYGRASFLMPASVRWGHKRGPLVLKDPNFEPGGDIGNPVAVDAGEVALEHGIDRAAQDGWAFRSQMAYAKAKANDLFVDEIVPVDYVDDRGKGAVLNEDFGPRPDTTLEGLAKLSPVFGSPTVTPGNAPGIDTGAAALLLTTRAFAESCGVEALATVVATHSIARSSREIAVAPATATMQLLDKVGWRLTDIDVLEINEAFAAVPLTSARVMAEGRQDVEKSILARLNVNGGAIALGHPPGASGARLLLTAIMELRRRGGGRATAAICGGLGQADAVALSVE